MRIKNIGRYLVALAVSSATIVGGEEPTVKRNLYDDARAHLATWVGLEKERQYWLSGKSLSGLNVSLIFEGETPTEAKIGLSPGRSLSVQSSGDRTVIRLFESIGKDISMTFDLDANGTWDVRFARQSGKREIFYDAQWHTVTECEGLTAAIPRAKVDDVEYEFSGGVWKPANK
jgi:hypothetical protein